jgi:hypothetical protein
MEESPMARAAATAVLRPDHCGWRTAGAVPAESGSGPLGAETDASMFGVGSDADSSGGVAGSGPAGIPGVLSWYQCCAPGVVPVSDDTFLLRMDTPLKGSRLTD